MAISFEHVILKGGLSNEKVIWVILNNLDSSEISINCLPNFFSLVFFWFASEMLLISNKIYKEIKFSTRLR